MTDSIHVECPHCQHVLRILSENTDRTVRCPKCSRFLTVGSAASGPSTSTSAGWLLRTEEGRVYGPVEFDQLSQWVDEGRVTASCSVAPEATGRWVGASQKFPQLVQQPLQAARPTSAPTGTEPFGRQRYSQRSRLVAGLLGLLMPLVGFSGIHRLYLGHIGIGLLMMITCGGCGIWQLIDVIFIFAGQVRDVDGLPLAP